jgi:hypothetical protein
MERGAMRGFTASLLGASLLLIPGCGAVGSLVCRHEAIRATLRTPLVSGEDAGTDTLAGNLEARNDENTELDAVETAIEGRTLAGRGVSMWLHLRVARRV